MKILICDDDRCFAHLLADDFNKFFKSKIGIVDIDIININFDSILENEYDICFMDIDLLSKNGINIVKKLKSKNQDLIVIFVSAREDLVFDTFSVEPFQFIRKNHYQSDLKDCLLQLEWKLKNRFIKIVFKRNNRFINIHPSEIISVISIEHDLIINTTKKCYYTTGTLKNFYELNSKTVLVQIQKNLIINMEKILSVNKNEILYVDKKKYVVGRVYRELFRKKYEEYLLQ